MRIGVLGGTFDPIHVGHLIIAETVRDEMALDKVLFIPAAAPPHKQRQPITAAADRLELVRLAVEGNAAFEPSDIEITRGGISYTIETVEALRRSHGEEADLYFIIGADTVPELRTWKDIDHLVRLCTFVVVARPGHRIEELLSEAVGLAPSSTDLRARLAQGKSVRYRLPEVVERSIRAKGLYGTKKSTPAAER